MSDYPDNDNSVPTDDQSGPTGPLILKNKLPTSIGPNEQQYTVIWKNNNPLSTNIKELIPQLVVAADLIDTIFIEQPFLPLYSVGSIVPLLYFQSYKQAGLPSCKIVLRFSKKHYDKFVNTLKGDFWKLGQLEDLVASSKSKEQEKEIYFEVVKSGKDSGTDTVPLSSLQFPESWDYTDHDSNVAGIRRALGLRESYEEPEDGGLDD